MLFYEKNWRYYQLLQIQKPSVKRNVCRWDARDITVRFLLSSEPPGQKKKQQKIMNLRKTCPGTTKLNTDPNNDRKSPEPNNSRPAHLEQKRK